MAIDLLFKQDNMMFSYRVAGVLKHGGKVLLQREVNRKMYAFPGGHAVLGETNQASLEREFMEELDLAIKVEKLLWTGEIFFPWSDGTPCHQICFFYEVSLFEADLDYLNQVIRSKESHIVFEWIDLKDIDYIELYPQKTKALVQEDIFGVTFVEKA